MRLLRFLKRTQSSKERPAETVRPLPSFSDPYRPPWPLHMQMAMM